MTKLKIKILGILLACLLIGPFSYAEEENSKSNLGPIIGRVLLFEGLTLVNSGLATLHPRAFGWMGIVISPVGLTEEATGPENFATWSGFVGLCAYNIIVPLQENLSDKTVFGRNVVGWHIWMAWVYGSHLIFGEKEPSLQSTLTPFNFGVSSKGAYFSFQYRFGKRGRGRS